MAQSERTSRLPGSVDEIAAHLAQWGKRAAWGLARVEFSSEFARRRVIDHLCRTFDEAEVPFREIAFPKSDSPSHLYRYLYECLETMPQGVVSITGWASAFSDGKALEDALRLLNFERENLSLPTLRQIWWLPSQVLETFVRVAPDLDSWFQTRLHLIEEDKPLFRPPLTPPDFLPVRKRHFNVPYKRNSHFTGREGLLAALHDALTKDKNAALTQAIYGLGGVGKTQLAVEYAYRYADEYTDVFWVRAETEDEIRQGFVQIARNLNLLAEQDNTPDRAVPVVLDWLQDPRNRGWLLIFDNADAPQLLRSYRPLHSQGTVLLTSRRHDFRAFGIHKSFNVNAWNQPDAVIFLCKRVGRNAAALPTAEQQAVADIADLLGGLPLALEQAGAYIAAQSMPFADYAATYRKRAERLLRDSKPETGNYRDWETNEYRTAWTTWDLNFQAVQAVSQASAEVLTFSAFLAPDAIPAELLLLGAEHIGATVAAEVEQKGREGSTYDNLLEPLMRYSLIQKDAERRTCTMHRLVQQVLRDHLNAEEQREQAERVVQALCAAYPGAEFEHWPRCERLLPHWRQAAEYIQRYAIVSIEAGALLNQIGYYLDERGQYAEAEPLVVQALNIRKKALPQSHPDIAASLNNLAGLYWAQGRYQEAEPLVVQALNIRQKALPQSHPDIAASLNNLAGLYRTQGRYQEAEPLLVQALEICERALGSQHPHVAISLNNLAALYWTQGRYEEAEPLFVQALDIRQKALPQGHHQIATNLNNLAGLYRAQGRYEDAEPLFVQALDIDRVALGEQHPNYATYLNNLAGLYREQGRYKDAEPLYVQALGIRQKALPQSHPDIAASLNNLAELYDSQGRYEDAEPLYVQALEIFERALGSQHPNTKIVRRNLETFRQKHHAK